MIDEDELWKRHAAVEAAASKAFPFLRSRVECDFTMLVFTIGEPPNPFHWVSTLMPSVVIDTFTDFCDKEPVTVPEERARALKLPTRFELTQQLNRSKLLMPGLGFAHWYGYAQLVTYGANATRECVVQMLRDDVVPLLQETRPPG
jgi:hypothetical protein